MSAHSPNFPHPSEIEHRVPVFPALKQRGRHSSNIWFFDSPKNNRRFSIEGDVAFMHFVLLEGDTSVVGYDPKPEPVFASIKGEIRKTSLDAHVFRKDGSVEWWEFKRHQDSGPSRGGRSVDQLSAQAQAASAAGVPYVVRTDLDLQRKEVLFDNWLNLCAGITRCRNQLLNAEAELFSERIAMQRTVSFSSLMEVPGIDRAHMFAVVALALQSGGCSADLEKSLFGLTTVLTRSEA